MTTRCQMQARRPAPIAEDRSACFVIIAADEGNLNIGDQAMYVNVCRRLRKRFPSCRIIGLGGTLANAVEVAGVERSRCGHVHFATSGGYLLRLLRRLPKGQRMIMLLRFLALQAATRTRRLWTDKHLWNEDCRDTVRTLAEADVVLSCGGGYLNSIWWADDLWPKCAMYAASARLRKPVIALGQGIGPITARLDALVLKMGLRNVGFVALREAGEGEDYLRRLGLPEDRFAVVGDEAVDLPICSTERLSDILACERVDPTCPTLVANFRSTAYTHRYGSEKPRMMAALMDRLVETHGYQIVFVPFCYDESSGVDDRTAAFDVMKHMRERDSVRIVMGQYRPEEIKAIVGLGACGVGVSYHFAVFALTQGVPCFSLYDNEYYRLKFGGLYAQFGAFDWYHQMTREGADCLVEQVRDAGARRGEIATELARCTNEMIARVDSVYDRIESIVVDVSGFVPDRACRGAQSQDPKTSKGSL